MLCDILSSYMKLVKLSLHLLKSMAVVVLTLRTFFFPFTDRCGSDGLNLLNLFEPMPFSGSGNGNSYNERNGCL
jgi:hypothetical protein